MSKQLRYKLSSKNDLVLKDMLFFVYTTVV
jgi:hypothetical protein